MSRECPPAVHPVGRRGVRGCFPRVTRGPGRVSAGRRAGFRPVQGGAVCESSLARAARPRAGGGQKGVRGETGKPAALGGFPGVPRDPCSFRPCEIRRGIRPGRYSAVAVRREPRCLHFPRSFTRRDLSYRGEAGGVWGTWNRGRVFPGGGGGSGFPSAFPDWSPLLSVYSQSRAVVFLTSPSCLVEGVRSGTRRAATARAGAALYGRCAAPGRGVCAAGRARPARRIGALGVCAYMDAGRSRAD
jgi:hypothetical protein